MGNIFFLQQDILHQVFFTSFSCPWRWISSPHFWLHCLVQQCTAYFYIVHLYKTLISEHPPPPHTHTHSGWFIYLLLLNCYEIVLLTNKALNNLAPVYLSDLFQLYIPSRSLRSSSAESLRVPNFKLRSFGGRVFSPIIQFFDTAYSPAAFYFHF